MYEKALEAKRKVYGAESSRTAWTLERIGQVFRETLQFDKALETFLKVLPVYEKEYGADPFVLKY